MIKSVKPDPMSDNELIYCCVVPGTVLALTVLFVVVGLLYKFALWAFGG